MSFVLARTIKNTRRPLRADFPPIVRLMPMYMDRDDYPAIVDNLKAEVSKCGIDFAKLTHINIVYPHKDPALRQGEINPSIEIAVSFANIVKHYAPHIQPIRFDALVETRPLMRKMNQNCLVHMLTERQEFAYHLDLQKEYKDHVASLMTQSLQGELFVLADDCLEKGTTAAEWISFIEHQGGQVLMATAATHRSTIAQSKLSGDIRGDDVRLTGIFADAGLNTQKLPALAEAFAVSAAKGGVVISPNEALLRFEEALQPFGHTVLALTNNECDKIVYDMRTYASSCYLQLLADLKNKRKPVVEGGVFYPTV